MTLAILILSEIIPKTIGANKWQSLAPFTIRSLNILVGILSPLVWVSQRITKTLKKDKQRSILSRADLSALAVTGAETGTLAQGESTIIQNLLKLEKLQVRDIMTPRTVMVTANEEENLKDFWDRQKPLPFSRVPVYQEKSDHITGMILKEQLLAELAENRPHQKLKDIKLPVAHVHDNDQLHKMLDHMVAERAHMAIVNDDFGSVVGLVSMEDLFETLLGIEIVDETDTVEDLQRLARQQWERRAAQKNQRS
jgi:CBS domain containing-hemolysin-like protein